MSKTLITIIIPTKTEIHSIMTLYTLSISRSFCSMCQVRPTCVTTASKYLGMRSIMTKMDATSTFDVQVRCRKETSQAAAEAAAAFAIACGPDRAWFCTARSPNFQN